MKNLQASIFIILMLVVTMYPSQSFSATDREQEVRAVVTKFVTSRTAGMGWDIHIRRMTIADVLKFPEGPVDYEIIAPQQWEGWGNVSVAVVARQKERVLRNVSVWVDVEALTDMVVALHQIENGELISASDVILQKRELTTNTHLAARTLSEVIGKKSRTILRENQPVRADLVEKVPLIKAGQMVTIVAENESLRISVSGKARSPGAEGDTIRVQNLTSQKEISARVINATTVQVAF